MTRPERPLALVTGASRGIGRAIAEALAPDHDLVLAARDASSLAEIQADAELTGAKVHSVGADLGTAEGRKELLASLDEREIDILVNNAGIAPSSRFTKTSDEEWSQTMELNATAPFELMRALLPGMIERGWGRILNVASTSALKGYRYTSAYSASKGALVALTRAVAAEVSSNYRSGRAVARTAGSVTVNAVCPGFTDTDITRKAVANISKRTGKDAAEARASLERFSPQGRMLMPVEVASLVRYLVSDAAASIHGQALCIDGGETTL